MANEWIIESDIVRLQRQMAEAGSQQREQLRQMIEHKREMLPSDHPQRSADDFRRGHWA